VGGEKGADGGVVELLAVVSLEGEDGATELHRHIRIKGGECRGDIRFLTKRKSPDKVRKIIENNEIIKKTRMTRYRGRPYITMK
jgi:hypothetical protein